MKAFLFASSGPTPKISQALKLGAISMATVHAAGNTYDSPVFKIDVILPNGLMVVDVRALEAKNIQGADMLIGMDIITTGNLAITNADNDTWFSFRFPSARLHTDYAEEAKRMIRAQAQTSDRQNMIKNFSEKASSGSFTRRRGSTSREIEELRILAGPGGKSKAHALLQGPVLSVCTSLFILFKRRKVAYSILPARM